MCVERIIVDWKPGHICRHDKPSCVDMPEISPLRSKADGPECALEKRACGFGSKAVETPALDTLFERDNELTCVDCTGTTQGVPGECEHCSVVRPVSRGDGERFGDECRRPRSPHLARRPLDEGLRAIRLHPALEQSEGEVWTSCAEPAS